MPGCKNYLKENRMKKYNLTFQASPATQVVALQGRGRVLHITISHSQDTPQTVTFYDRSGTQIAL